jgi:hypothetical protein
MHQLTKDAVNLDCGSCVMPATIFQICLYFILRIRSLCIVLHWNGKAADVWMKILLYLLGIRYETLVIITILTWCCTRIQGVISACTSVQSESNQQVSPVHRNCWESVKRVIVCVFCFEINLSKLCLLTKSKISALKENQSLWTFLVICVCVCVCVCFQTYSFWDIIIILLADLQWHWWWDSCSHCWRMCSVGQEEGLWSVLISTWPICWGPSWKTSCSKVYIMIEISYHYMCVHCWTCIVGRGGCMCLLTWHSGPCWRV